MMQAWKLGLGLLAVATLAPVTHGQGYTWNNGSGNSLWNTSSANFLNVSTPVVWSNSNPTAVLFQSAGAGTLTVSSIDLHSIYFNANGYVLNSGTLNFVNTMTISGFVAGTVYVNTGYTATINSQITGVPTSFNKAYAGTLILGNGGNNFAGNVFIDSGTLVAAASGNGTNSTLGALSGTKSITVGDSNSTATLSFTINNVFGGGGMTAANLPTIFVNPGSTVTSTRFNTIGHINLYGSTLTHASTDTSGYEGFQFIGVVRVFGSAGATSYISSSNGRGNHLAGGNNSSGGTAFNVDENLIVSTPLLDPCPDYANPATGRLIKNGDGVMRLHANNTYTGVTLVNAGVLFVGNGTNVGTLGTGTVVVNPGGVLAYQRSDSPTLSNVYGSNGTNGTIIFYGTSVVDQSSYALSANSSSFNGAFSVDNSAGLSKARLILTNGNQIGSGSVTVNNGSGLFISGGTYNNTFNLIGNGWTESAGQLGAMRVGNGSTVGGTINLIGNTRFHTHTGETTGVITANITDGTGSFAIEKTGVGTITISGTNTYDGGTNISAGTLRMGVNNVMPASNVVTVSTGATFDLNNTNQTIAQLVGSGSVTLGSGSLTLSSSVATALPAPVSGTGTLIKAGTGTLTISNSIHTYTGGTIVNGGILEFSAPQVTATGTVTVNSGTTLQFSQTNIYGNHTTTSTSHVVVNSGTMTNSGDFYNTLQNLTLNDGTVTNTGSFGATWRTWSVRGTVTSTGTSAITLTGTNAGLNLSQSGIDTYFVITSGALTITGTILNNRDNAGTADVPGYLHKQGVGTLILNGTNTFTGGVILTQGALQFVNAAAMPPTGNITFTGGVLQYVASNLTDYSNRFSTAVNQVYNVDTNGQNVTLATALTSVGGVFTKLGSGTLTLSGPNTYTSGTNINAGMLALGSSGALGTTGTISFGGGILQHSASNTTDYSSRFSTAASQPYSVDTNGQNVTWASGLTSSGGMLTKLGSGILTLTGANTYTGTTTINGGTLRISRTDTRTYTGDFTGSASLEQFGTGTTIFTGNVSTANITVTAGIMQIGSGSTTGTLTSNVSNNGSLRFNRSNAYTFSNVVSGTGTLQQLGTGVLTLSGLNTYTGTTSIVAGTLQLGISNAVPTTGTLDLAAAGTFNLNGFNQTVATLTGSGAINLNNGTLTINSGAAAAVISGTGTVIKATSGTLTLSGASTFTGGISVIGGTLNVSSTLGSGSVNFSNFATLQFTGSTTTTRSFYLNGSLMRVTSGNTLTLNNAVIGGGYLTGTFTTQAGSTNLITSGTQNVASAITFNGTDTVTNFTLNGSATTPATRTTTMSAVTLGASGTMTVGGTVNAGEFLSYGTLTLNAGAIVNHTSSNMTLGGGSRTFLATPGNTVSTKIDLGGFDLVVAGGFLQNNGGNFASGGGIRNGTVIVDYGGKAKGSGYYEDVLTQNGGIFSPGNSPGNTQLGTSRINSGGTLNIDIDAAGPTTTNPSAIGTVGAAPGWGRVQTTSALRITATPSSKFTITLTSQQLGGASAPGIVANFDNTQAYKWEVIQMQSGANLFNVSTGGTPIDPSTYVWDPSIANVDTGAFQNNLGGGVFSTSFSLNSSSTYSVFVNFTPSPVPEPTMIFGIAAVGLGLSRRIRRCWK